VPDAHLDQYENGDARGGLDRASFLTHPAGNSPQALFPNRSQPVTSNEPTGRPTEPPESLAGTLLDLLVTSDHLHELLAGITDLAVETIPGCESASITVIHEMTPTTPASSGARARKLDESQYGQGQGPCLQAARTGQAIQIDDIPATPTDAWQRAAREAHVTASLSMPLISSANIEAALNLYTGRDGGWPADAYNQAETLAAYAGDVITLAYRMTHPEDGAPEWPYRD
jgi:transcriptional regulator with GAF, ATPase, and Fis domain